MALKHRKTTLKPAVGVFQLTDVTPLGISPSEWCMWFLREFAFEYKLLKTFTVGAFIKKNREIGFS